MKGLIFYLFIFYLFFFFSQNYFKKNKTKKTGSLQRPDGKDAGEIS